MNSKPYKIFTIRKIAVPNLKNKIIGALVLTYCIIITKIGFSPLNDGYTQPYLGSFILGIANGLLISTAGITIDTLGLVILLSKKEYNLSGKWSLRVKNNPI